MDLPEKSRACAAILLMCANPAISMAGNVDSAPVQIDLQQTTDTAGVTNSAVRAPTGAFLLAREGKYRCAVRIDRVWRSGTDEPPSAFSSGGPDTYANYTAYYRTDGGVTFRHQA